MQSGGYWGPGDVAHLCIIQNDLVWFGLCLPAMTASDVGKRFPTLLYSLFTFVCVGVWVRVCGCVCLFAVRAFGEWLVGGKACLFAHRRLLSMPPFRFMTCCIHSISAYARTS